MNRQMLMCGVAITTLIAMQSASAQEAVENEPGEIIVTANKRAQSIYEVSSSVSSIATEVLESKGVNDLRGLAQEVPGLSIFSRGSTGANLIILRGLSSGSSTISPTVGFYVNDTAFGFSIPVGGGSSVLQPDLDPSDIDRIEVLRGPQGTLYGASTLGGLIKYVTRKPDTRSISGSVQASAVRVAHGDVGAIARAALNLPLIDDKLAVRVSGFYRADPGFIDNSRTGERDVNEVDAYGGRISLGVYPNEDLSIIINGQYQKNENRSLGTENLDPVTLQPSPRDLTQRYYRDTTFNSKYQLVDGLLSWRIGDYTLNSSTSYGRSQLIARFDFTNLLPAGFLGAAYYLGPQDLLYKKFSQEVRLSSPNGQPLEWVIGAYYTNEDVATRTTVDGFTAFGEPAPLVPTISRSSTDAKYREFAGFVNVTYNLTSELSLTGGLRLAENKITDEIRTSGLLSGVALDAPIVQNGRQKDDVATYLASANWRYAPQGQFYLKAASGYRPGGPVEPPPVLAPGQVIPTEFKADTVWNFEAGNRHSFMDGLLMTDVSAFYIRWNDIQLPYTVNGIRVLANGGKAISQGFEFQTTLKPVAGLALTTVGSYTDAHLTTEAPLVFGRSGDALPFVPKWNLTANIDYETLLTDTITGSIGATYHYQSGVRTALSALDSSYIAFDGFSTADLRAALGWDSVRLNVFVRNMFDKRAYIAGGRSGGLANGVPIQPRTLGISLSTQF